MTPTSATGGTGISADKTSASGGSTTYTTITGPSFAEGAFGDVTGDITLTAPAGFNFKASTGTCTKGAGDGTATIGTVTTTTATCTITASTATADSYSFSGLQVIPTSGTIASGNISASGGYSNANVGSLSSVAGAATKLAFTTQPVGGVARNTNLATQPVVKVQDQFGNTVTTATDDVTLAIHSGTGASGAALSATTNPVTAAAGIATFAGVKIDKSGTGYTLDATATGLTTATSSAFNITGVGSVVFSTQPTGAAKNANLGTQPVVTLRRDDNTTETTDSTSTITLTRASGGTAVTIASNTATAASGIATFSGVQLNKSGTTFVLQASDGNGHTVNSNSFNITGVASVTFSTQPTGAAKNTDLATQPVVTLLRDDATTETTSSATITLTRASGGVAGVTIASNSVAASSGVATFSGVQLNKSGTSYVLQASDGTNTVNSNSFNITGVASITFSTQPTGAAKNADLGTQPVVTLLRDDSTTETTSSATITLTRASGGFAGVTIASNSVAASSGVATFSGVQLNKSGTTYVLQASDGTNTVNSNSFNITGVASIAFTTQPAGAAKNADLGTQPVVTLKRDDGTTETTSSATITLTRASGGFAGVTIASNSVAASSGVATFSGVQLNKSGTTYVLQASDGTNTANSNSFNITGVASLTFSTQPTGAAKNANLGTQPVVTLLRDDSTTETTSSATITLTRASGGFAGVTIASNSVAASSGVATFSGVQLNKSGTTYVLQASDGTNTVNSNSFNITGVASLTFSTQPTGAAKNVDLGTQPVVTLLRDDSTTETTSSATITLTRASGGFAGVTIAGNSVAASSGVATFSGVQLNKSGTTYVLQASDGTNTVNSNSFNITGVASIAFTTQPAGAAKNVDLGTQPVVTLKRDDGTTETTSSATITLTRSSGGTAVTIANNSVAASSGVATFTGVQLDKSGTGFVLQASDGTNTATSNSLNITGVASIAFTTQPVTAARNTNLGTQPVVTLKRDDGTTETTSSATITLTRASGGFAGVTIASNSVAASSGVATFSGVQLNKSGTTYVLQASDGTNTANSNSFNITGVASVAFTTQPSGAVRNTAFTTQPVVTLKRDDGTTETTSSATITLTISSGGAGTESITAGTTAVASSGVATFSGTKIDKSSGTAIVLQASDGTNTTTSNSFTVTGVASIAFTTQPTGAAKNANLATQPVVTLKRDDGTTETGSSATITLTRSSGGSAGVTIASNSVAASSGVATFSGVQLDKSGTTYVLQASDGTNTATSNSFNITGVASVAFTTQPTGAAKNVNLATQPVVTLKRDDGTTETTSSATITLTRASGGSAGVTIASNSVAASSGVATFSGVQLDKSGTTYVLQASDGTNTVNSNSFNITGVASVAFMTQPSGAVRNTAFTTQPVVTLRRDDGTTETTSSATITLTISSGGAGTESITAGTTAVASSGVATFSGTKIDKSSGTAIVLQASDGTNTTTSNSFTVTGVASIAFTTQPSGAVRNTAFTTQPVVTLKRDDGATETGSSATITLTISSGGAGTESITAGTTAVASSGVATFSGTKIDKSSGTAFVLQASDGSGHTITSNSFSVSGVATVAFTTQPSGAVKNTAFTTQPVVTLKRDDGTTETGSSATVTLTISSGGASGATISAGSSVAASSGVATFSGTKIDKSGNTYVLQASDGSGHTITATAFNVTGVASVSFTTQPSGAAKNTAFTTQPVVTLLRDDGNTETTSTATITLTISSGGASGATVSAGATATATAGVATFSGTKIDKSGNSYVLQASDGASHTANATAFNVTGVGSISFTTQPGGGAAKDVVFPTQPVVTLLRDDGNTETTSSATITLTISSCGGCSAALSGGSTAVASSGVATFSGTKVNGGSSGMILQASDGASHTANSSSFSVAATATTTTLSITTPSGGAAIVAGQSVTLSANVGQATATGTVTFKDGTTTLGSVSLNGSTGIATFTTTLLRTVGSRSLTAVYAGDNNFGSSTSSAVTQTVTKASTTIAVVSSNSTQTSGNSVTFTATVTATAPGSGSATGTVTFQDNGVTLGTGTLSGGDATYTTSSLGEGTHTITVIYAGDTNYNAPTNASLTQQVNAPPKAAVVVAPVVPAGGTSAVVTAGSTATVKLTVAPTAVNTGANGAGAPPAADSPAVQTSVAVPALKTAATVVVAPATAPTTGGGSSGGFAAGSAAIDVKVTDDKGNEIHQFDTPLAITFDGVPLNFSPTTSDDGVTWRAIPLVSGPEALTGNVTDGYVRNGTSITIYTKHLSKFAVQRVIVAAAPLAVKATATLRQKTKVLAVTLNNSAVTHVNFTLKRGTTVVKTWHQWFLKAGAQNLSFSLTKLTGTLTGLTLGIDAAGPNGKVTSSAKVKLAA